MPPDIPAVIVEDENEDEQPETPKDDRRSFVAWQAYYEQRQQLCYKVCFASTADTPVASVDREDVQHALTLESMLHENPDNRQWLEQHGFDVDKLVRYLRWNPAEQLRQLERMDPVRKAR